MTPELMTNWSVYYGNHTAVAGALQFLHLAGVVVGGGTALAADRLVLLRSTSAADRERVLATLADAHGVVLLALAVVVASGALMFLADTETFLASSTYAAKMLGVVVLGANGAGLRHAEQQIARSGAERWWRRLRLTAAISSCAWLAVLLLGVWLAYA